METEWMGRYRKLVAALLLHGNVAISSQSNRLDIGEGICLKPQQWEIFEYIIEHRDKGFRMVEISYNLSIPRSTFSKTVKMLCEYGLVEKNQAVDNRKNIFLRPTAFGLKTYARVSQAFVRPSMQHFFDALQSVSDEDLDAFVKAIKLLDNGILPERMKEESILSRP